MTDGKLLAHDMSRRQAGRKRTSNADISEVSKTHKKVRGSGAALQSPRSRVVAQKIETRESELSFSARYGAIAALNASQEDLTGMVSVHDADADCTPLQP